MAEAAAARREARRRRILENSNNRLQVIAGIATNDSPRISPIRHQHPEQNTEVPCTSQSSTLSKSSLNNGALVGSAEPYELLSRHDTVAAGDGDLSNVLTAFSSANLIQSPISEPIQTPSVWEKITVHRYDIVLLSLFIQLLYGLSLVSVDGTYVFLPFAVYVITKLIFFPVQNNSKIANVLLLLNNLSRQANGLQKILYVTQWSGIILQDLSVYLFTTICVQSLCVVLKEHFLT